MWNSQAAMVERTTGITCTLQLRVMGKRSSCSRFRRTLSSHTASAPTSCPAGWSRDLRADTKRRSVPLRLPSGIVASFLQRLDSSDPHESKGARLASDTRSLEIKAPNGGNSEGKKSKMRSHNRRSRKRSSGFDSPGGSEVGHEGSSPVGVTFRSPLLSAEQRDHLLALVSSFVESDFTEEEVKRVLIARNRRASQRLLSLRTMQALWPTDEKHRQSVVFGGLPSLSSMSGRLGLLKAWGCPLRQYHGYSTAPEEKWAPVGGSLLDSLEGCLPQYTAELTDAFQVRQRKRESRCISLLSHALGPRMSDCGLVRGKGSISSSMCYKYYYLGFSFAS